MTSSSSGLSEIDEWADAEAVDPTVYQVPLKTGDGAVRANFQRTIIEGVAKDQIESIVELPSGREKFVVWGNRENEPAKEGDYLLFADRDGRDGGEYTRLAKISHASVLDADTAAAFTDAVGWGEVTDDIFPHVMFLSPVYEADLDRESFWNTIGFKGWPNDTYSAINFDRRKGKFFEEYDSVQAFIEQIKGRQLFPDTSEPEYDSLDAVYEDVRMKLSQSDSSDSWATKHIGKAVIEDWSRALSGFQPSDSVSPATGSTFDQIRTVYESLRPELEAKADELAIGPLDALSPPKVLFLGTIRNLQDDNDFSSSVFNQPRLNSILNEAYSTEGTSINPSEIGDHTVSVILSKDSPTVYKFTAPPDYWLTAVEYGSVSFRRDQREQWNDVQAGDVVLFHSRAKPSTDEFADQQNGLIGAGVFGETFEKQTSWWWDEYRGNEEFPLVATFDRMFLTGDFEKLDTSRGVEAKYQQNSVARINDELSALTENCLSLSDANERCQRVGGTAFPAQGMFGTFRTDDGDVDYDRPNALVVAMSDDLTEVPVVNIHKPFSGALADNSAEILDGLYFPDQQGRGILEQIETALSAGKHILLTGPPGTGKTEIAERVSAHLARNHPHLFSGYEMTTATADWSTFDTVGGYMPNESGDSGQNLSFNPGIVLNRLKRTKSGIQPNELTIIDELNRADIDKAFGQLFTLGPANQIETLHKDETLISALVSRN